MIPELRRLHSPDIDDLTQLATASDQPWSVLLELSVGPHGESGDDLFTLIVCNPKWIEQSLAGNGHLHGRYHLFFDTFDLGRTRSAIEHYLMSCSAETWAEVAAKVGRMAHWVFEDHQQS